MIDAESGSHYQIKQVDYFEIEDDMLDGIRGNSASPIRYDDRTTS